MSVFPLPDREDTARRSLGEGEPPGAAALIEASPDAIVVCALDARVVLWNGVAELFYGHTAQHALGQSLELVFPPAALAAARGVWTRASRGERVSGAEYARPSDGGPAVVISTMLTPLRDATGEIAWIVVQSRDVTATAQVRDALSEAHAKALEASRLKSEFIANMNHELRTPMNGVLGVASLLADTKLDEEQREYVDTLKLSGEAMMSVIRDILDFSKLEAAKLRIDDAPFDLRKLVDDVCAIVAVGAAAKGVEVVTSFDGELPELVLGDRDRLRQVLLNLTGNAAKFTDAGRVTVGLRWIERSAQGSELTVEVTDTGIGVAGSAQQLIFKSFVQADGSTTRRHGGTGLGLTISKDLVELMGGEIGVRSALGEGSTFWFTVPMSAATQADADEPSLPSLEGVRVLLAVPDAAVGASLEARLLSWDVSVGLANDLATAQRLAGDMARLRTPYDVLLIDAALLGGSAQPLLDAEIDPSHVIVLTAPGAPAFGGGTQSVARSVQPSRLYGELARAIDHDREADSTDSTDSADGGDHAAPTTEPSGHTGRVPRVLVAEDNANNRLVAVRMLQHRGLAVNIAVDGRQAVAMHREAPYDAIFMDCMMPVLDGYEATREIRRSDGGSRHTPIVAMTANTMPGDADRCLVAGMDFYSPKPISPTGLDYVLGLALPGARSGVGLAAFTRPRRAPSVLRCAPAERRGAAGCGLGAARGGDRAFAGGLQALLLRRGRRRQRDAVVDQPLMAVKQVLVVFGSELGLVDLGLAAVVAILCAAELGRAMAQPGLLHAILGIGCLAGIAAELQLVGDVRLLAVGQGLLAVGDALTEVGEHLVLVQSLLFTLPVFYFQLVAHAAAPFCPV